MHALFLAAIVLAAGCRSPRDAADAPAAAAPATPSSGTRCVPIARCHGYLHACARVGKGGSIVLPPGPALPPGLEPLPLLEAYCPGQPGADKSLAKCIELVDIQQSCTWRPLATAPDFACALVDGECQVRDQTRPPPSTPSPVPVTLAASERAAIATRLDGSWITGTINGDTVTVTTELKLEGGVATEVRRTSSRVGQGTISRTAAGRYTITESGALDLSLTSNEGARRLQSTVAFSHGWPEVLLRAFAGQGRLSAWWRVPG